MALVGCGAPDDKPTAAEPTASPSFPGSPSPSPSTTTPTLSLAPTSAPPSPSSPLRLGRTADLGAVKITVQAYRQGSSNDRAVDIESSENWASVDVRLCNTSTASIEVNDDYWTLQSAGSTEYEKANFQDFAMPQQPVYGGRVLQPSKCTRGWISFVVQRDDAPVLAVYNNEADQVEWALKR
ncbi:DUF4352 domain-containing protein [Micromonospora peucetia]|uniref:DUF4352 domain-containing protein n=1 Tax=Micromonospora peucetia TaxID=47871 RepID=A0ABZ1END8_9ACTN|nr:DUF4352 domain-containing protein [Micromonospora peucetia]WSA35742.1 DUF4352 domain-containing protein [Micromonospora peucetia]